jgi:hypothetical protein
MAIRTIAIRKIGRGMESHLYSDEARRRAAGLYRERCGIRETNFLYSMEELKKKVMGRCSFWDRCRSGN